MKYMTYYETEEIISEKEYQKAFLLLQGKDHQKLEKHTDEIERYRFAVSLEGVRLPEYSLCRKNKTEFYLEKKSLQESLVWRESDRITREEALKMKKGDIAWMEADPRHLVRDFYLQMTINCLRFDFLEVYEREQYRCQKTDFVVFHRNVRRIRGSYTLECMPKDMVRMRIRRAKTIPRVIQGMLQGMEFSNELPAYA